jgi:hypothetical protein
LMLLLKLTCFLLPVSRRIQTSPPRPPLLSRSR